MTIAFVRQKKAFLPGLTAYLNFFKEKGIQCSVIGPEELSSIDYDVSWHFMGLDFHGTRKNTLKIHEYCSASTPPLSSFKNLCKSVSPIKPDFRIFLNEYVHAQFHFKDKVPKGYRNIGIQEDWLLSSPQKSEIKFDFVYTGDLTKYRAPHQMLSLFTDGSLRHQSILVVGKDYEQLAKEYTRFKNIIFQGPFPHHMMLGKLREARYGLNFMPDRAPFNLQTSTKFLEYAAAGLPIVSTDYAWVRNFKKDYGGNYFFFKPGTTTLNIEDLDQFSFESPDLKEWTWQQQIYRSGVLNILGLE